MNNSNLDKNILEKIGFQMREFGDNTIIVEGVPPDISQGVEEKVIKEVHLFSS